MKRTRPQSIASAPNDELICPVCLEIIRTIDNVRASGGGLMHSACDYAKGDAPPTRSS
jgi:hypothetical protein